MALGKVQVDGGLFQVSMSQQDLNGAQICTGFEQVRGEALSTLPDDVLYRHARLVFRAISAKQRRHRIELLSPVRRKMSIFSFLLSTTNQTSREC